MIPNIIHFVFLKSGDVGGLSFALIHYLAIRSAYECNRPDKIYFHCDAEPTGEWWQKAKGYVTLSSVQVPKEVFGRPLLHIAHAADVVRLEVLMKYGGIYLDIDVICLKSFAPLLRHSVVMGRERSGGFCNAVILAEPGAPFIQRWHDEYRSFRSTGKNDYWSEHSGEKPFEIARQFPNEIRIVSRYHFFWPGYHEFAFLFGVSPHRNVFERMIGHIAQPVAYLVSKRLSYCIHLYESMWWDKYLKDLTPESIRKMNRSFGWLCRGLLPSEGRIRT